MNMAVADSLVAGYEDLISSLTLRDKDDRHVLAVAIRSDADSIVTFNLKDFHEVELQKYSVFTEHPDDFVCNMIDISQAKSLSAIKAMRNRLRNPPRSVEELSETLQEQDLTKTAARLLEFSDLL